MIDDARLPATYRATGRLTAAQILGFNILFLVLQGYYDFSRLYFEIPHTSIGFSVKHRTGVLAL